MKHIICIAAVADNWVIGKDGKLPWRLPADLKFFKAQTLGHTLIHGRKSHESMGGALPGRRNIVLTRQDHYDSKDTEVAHSMAEALELGGDDNPVFVLGGQKVFEAAVNEGIATHMILTRVHADVEGDTTFPEFDESQWQRTWHEFRPKDNNNPIDMTFERWERQPNN